MMGAHQRPHRDLLDVNGVSVRKTWLPEHLSLGEALNYAIEIEQN